MRVCIIGHRGMLGHVLSRYLAENHCTVLSLQQHFSQDTARTFVQEIEDCRPDWCINCAVLRHEAGCDESRLAEVNTALPFECISRLPASIKFLHTSSDGVFREDQPARAATELPDALDPYGRSKGNAERVTLDNGGYIIRCSIIGPELNTRRSLMSWFLHQTGTVFGYENHHWNGITTLEWAKLALGIVTGLAPHSGRIFQPGVWPPTTKAALLRAIGKEWSIPTAIVGANSERVILRTLLPNLSCPDLTQQLLQLHQWYYSAPKSTRGPFLK